MSAFTEALYELPTERLRQIAVRRDVDPRRFFAVRNKQEFVSMFAQELAHPQSINEALRHCTTRELRLLQHLVISDGAVTSWNKLAELTGLSDPQTALSDVIEGLVDHGLAFRRGKGMILAQVVQQQVPVSPSDRYTVPQLLNNYDAVAVRTVRDALNLPASQETKANNIERICEVLLAPGGVKLPTPLDEQEQEVLEFIIAAGGSAMAGEIATNILQSRLQDFYGYDWQNRWKHGRAKNAVDRLMARGLIYCISWSYGFNLMLIIPGDLLRAMSGGDESAFWTGAPPALEPMQKPLVKTYRQTALVKDIVQFLGLLATLDAARTSTGQIHRTALKSASRLMSLADEKYGLFVYSLCRSANLVAPVGEKQIYGLTKTGDTFLKRNAAEQWRVLYEAWRNSALWAEMDTEPLAKSNDHRDTKMVVSIRDAALETIREAAGEDFYSTESVTDVMVSQTPLILASNMFGISMVPSPAAFVRHLIDGPLYWLGVIELGEHEGWTKPEAKITMRVNRAFHTEEITKPALPDPPAFRLTPIGKWLIGQKNATVPEPEPREDHFILQPNAEIFVSPYLASAIHYRLLTMVEIPKNGNGSMVALTKEAIRKALDHGETTQEILAFFQAHSKTGIPQNVEYLLNEVGGKHGHIHIGYADLYLQTDTAFLMQELLARKELKAYSVRALSETIALLQGDNYDKLLKDLRKAGYLPVSDEDAPAAYVVSGSTEKTAPLRFVDIAEVTPIKTGGKTLDNVNWEKIAADDTKPYSAPANSTRLQAGVARHPDLVKFILNQGIKNNLRIEVAYRTEASGEPIILHVEPVKIVSNILRAYSMSDDDMYSVALEQIDWVRLTDERFVAR